MADAVERRLEALLEGRDYVALRAALSAAAPDLSPAGRAYFAGVLANRENRITDSIRLLAGGLPGLESGGDAGRLRAVLIALADDYVKAFRYALAADTFATLEKRFGPTMTAADRNDNRASLKLFAALRSVPPQRAETGGPFALAVTRNPLGLPTVPVAAGGTRGQWVLDTGASLSTISESAARRLGLTFLSDRTVPVGAVTGKSVPGHVAAADALRVGGATLRNVAFLVLRDQDLYVAPEAYQVHATLGFPALAALGRLTFTRDGRTLRVAPTGPHGAAAAGPGSDLFLEALQPLIAARTGGDGAERLFTLDTGAKSSFLTLRYFQEHRQEFAGKAARPLRIGGAGGVRGLKGFLAPSVTFVFPGGRRATLRQVPVLTVPVGQPQDGFYGNLGQDVLGQFAAYTLDFAAMRLTLG